MHRTDDLPGTFHGSAADSSGDRPEPKSTRADDDDPPEHPVCCVTRCSEPADVRAADDSLPEGRETFEYCGDHWVVFSDRFPNLEVVGDGP